MEKAKIVVIVGILCLAVIISVNTVRSSENTVVSGIQDEAISYVGQQFNITINCYPTEPIKAYELKLSYDPTVLQADLVTEGNIFNGYETFFSRGVINNVTGNITNIYGLILGANGNTSSSGSLVKIQFTCKQVKLSTIRLYDVGITNESEYIPITVSNVVVSLNNDYDVNQDNQCNLQDILEVAMHYGEQGTPGWIRADVSKNGVVDIPDFLYVSRHYGESW